MGQMRARAVMEGCCGAWEILKILYTAAGGCYNDGYWINGVCGSRLLKRRHPPLQAAKQTHFAAWTGDGAELRKKRNADLCQTTKYLVLCLMKYIFLNEFLKSEHI